MRIAQRVAVSALLSMVAVGSVAQAAIVPALVGLNVTLATPFVAATDAEGEKAPATPLLVVQIRTGKKPVVGTPVTFTVTQGGGSVSTATAVTNSEGTALPTCFCIEVALPSICTSSGNV